MSDGPIGRLLGFGNICPDCGQEIGDHIYCGEGTKARCPNSPALSRSSPVTETLADTLLDINSVHWNALRGIVEWWESLPPNLRQDIEGSGREPAAIANARKALPYAPAGLSQTPDLEAAVGRVMRIRNGMVLDGDAEDIIRKEIGALMGSNAKCQQQPVAWRYDLRMRMFATGDDDGWTTTVSFKEPKDDHRNEHRNVVPLFAALSDTSTDRTGK